jgi:hypothetical protein
MARPRTSTTNKTAGISSAAVKKATGKDWKQWFTLLDKAGARKMPHKDIACLVYEKHQVSGWWAQMVTVGYEQARGLRQKHQAGLPLYPFQGVEGSKSPPPLACRKETRGPQGNVQQVHANYLARPDQRECQFLVPRQGQEHGQRPAWQAG